MPLRPPLALLLLGGASAWERGQICRGVNLTSDPAEHMLRGKHLVVSDLVWSPFAYID